MSDDQRNPIERPPTCYIWSWWLMECGGDDSQARGEILNIVRSASTYFDAGADLREWFQERLTIDPGSGRAPFTDLVTNLLTEALQVVDWTSIAEQIGADH